MTNHNCLVCENLCTNYKEWNENKILICDHCLFSFIKTNKAEKGKVFSVSMNRSIIRHKERSDILKNC